VQLAVPWPIFYSTAVKHEPAPSFVRLTTVDAVSSASMKGTRNTGTVGGNTTAKFPGGLGVEAPSSAAGAASANNTKGSTAPRSESAIFPNKEAYLIVSPPCAIKVMWVSLPRLALYTRRPPRLLQRSLFGPSAVTEEENGNAQRLLLAKVSKVLAETRGKRFESGASQSSSGEEVSPPDPLLRWVPKHDEEGPHRVPLVSLLLFECCCQTLGLKDVGQASLTSLSCPRH
jgi:hypothetical protein